jgi:hypothetical protein
VARLYSAIVRRFMEYWTNNVKTIEIGKLVEGKSSVIKKWLQGEEDDKKIGVLKEYKAVMEAIRFVGVMHMDGMLTRRAVYAGAEYLGVAWLTDLLEQREVDVDYCRWNEVLKEVKQDMFSLEIETDILLR